MKKLLSIAFVLIAASASAQSVVSVTTPSAEFDAAVALVRARINADRAQKLADINAQRDAALPRVTATQADLLPLSTGAVLVLLATPALDGELHALAVAADKADAEAARAIRTKSRNCPEKATAAGLDPAVVCK